MSARIPRRKFLQGAAALGIASTLPTRRSLARNVNNEVNLGFIGCGGRGNNLSKFFSGLDSVNIAALCDPDESRTGKLGEKFPSAKRYTDLRQLLDNDDIDAVVIATCNHWHCLAAIWAMEAGKDVYVEKPLSHSQWEGRQTVAATEKYDRICQVGTHQRSDSLQDDIKRILHKEKRLGEILAVRANRFGVRERIGRRDKPMSIPASVNYDLWLGPAQDRPIMRDELHYDWHWDFNTGSGEMGNWGVHILDDIRNTVFQDSVSMPSEVVAGGGRVAWDDAGESPNVHVAYFNAGGIPVVLGLANLTAKPGSTEAPPHEGPASGYVVYCEGGTLHGEREKFAAYDADGKLLEEKETSGGNHFHQQNFVDAVRQHDNSLLNSPVEQGHFTAGWCNMANIAFQSGSQYSQAETLEINSELWPAATAAMTDLLKAHDVSLDDAALRLSARLKFDAESEQFVGENAAAANKFLRREYRKGFEVPEVAAVAAAH